MARLTLSIDAALVERAKRFAAAHGTSVSHLVAGYLDLLTRAPRPAADTPLLARLRGTLKGAETGVSEYRRHLERKHR